MTRFQGSMALALLLAACSSEAPPAPPGGAPAIEDAWAPEGPASEGEGTLNPVLPGRAPKRLTVDQLRRVVPQIAGGNTWHLDFPFDGKSLLIPMFDLMGVTLGEADYITTNVDFVDPIPSFMKYVDEMAAQVCTNAVLSEDGSIVAHDDVDDNLRFLRLKFHGLYVPPGSTEGIVALRGLYDDLDAQFAEQEYPYTLVPWIGVCLAVMTDPEFYIY
jgi:hypothetical protein